jgi:hypothetical protein
MFVSTCDVAGDELVLDTPQEDPLEIHFSDPQQNYGSPTQLANELREQDRGGLQS